MRDSFDLHTQMQYIPLPIPIDQGAEKNKIRSSSESTVQQQPWALLMDSTVLQDMLYNHGGCRHRCSRRRGEASGIMGATTNRAGARAPTLRPANLSAGWRTDISLPPLFCWHGAGGIDRGLASDAALRSNTRGARSRSESSRSRGVDILALHRLACPRWNSRTAATGSRPARHMCPPRPR